MSHMVRAQFVWCIVFLIQFPNTAAGPRGTGGYMWAVGDAPPDLATTFADRVHATVPSIRVGLLKSPSGVGAFPCIDCGPVGSPLFCNGGLPQLVNLTDHFRRLEHDLLTARSIPPNYTGHIALDFEEWRADMMQPPDAWGSARFAALYRNASIAWAREQVGSEFPEGQLAAFAQAELATAMLRVLTETLRFLRGLFPSAAGVGLYGYPSKHYWPLPPGENQSQADDALTALYAASTALYPSIYLPYPSGVGEHHQTLARNTEYVDSVLRESVRVARQHTGVDGQPLGVFPFAWYRYDDATNDFLSANDTALEFVRPLGFDGVRSVVVWGKEKTAADIANVERYFVENAALLNTGAPPIEKAESQPQGTSAAWRERRSEPNVFALAPRHFASTSKVPPYTPCSL